MPRLSVITPKPRARKRFKPETFEPGTLPLAAQTPADFKKL